MLASVGLEMACLVAGLICAWPRTLCMHVVTEAFGRARGMRVDPVLRGKELLAARMDPSIVGRVRRCLDG